MCDSSFVDCNCLHIVAAIFEHTQTSEENTIQITLKKLIRQPTPCSEWSVHRNRVATPSSLVKLPCMTSSALAFKGSLMDCMECTVPRYEQAFSEYIPPADGSQHTYINSLNSGYQPFRGPVRREHPLVSALNFGLDKSSAYHLHHQVRTHPVTRLKSLFYNPSYVIHISELKGQEGVHALNFLREHLHAADDLTVRWKWVNNAPPRDEDPKWIG